LRISEAIALRIMDADLDVKQPRIHVRRAIVDGQLTGPKSRHGRRTIPISQELADRLADLAVGRGESELLFIGARGATLRPGNLRYRVVIPAAERAGVPWARCHTLRHTCAALLIDAGATTLRRSRWTTTATSSATTSALTSAWEPTDPGSAKTASLRLG
jgi:integrase